MINRFLLLLGSLLLLIAPGTYAQYENMWVFGTNSGLDFNSGTPTPFNASINTSEGSASVCGANGQLLFYTNGERVWDRTHNIMQNGFSICSYSTGSTTQAALIVPMPDSSSKYYIFSLTPFESGWGRLFYSVVDLTLNNGLGGVIAGRKEILVDTGLLESMTATSGNDCNIWLLTVAQNGFLKAFNIDANGINFTPVQSPVIPGGGTLDMPRPGGMSVSRNRKKLAIADLGLSLYDFNASTGIASNPLSLSISSSNFYYSNCFSPDNSKLYASRAGLPPEQYDLSSGNPATIVASRTNFAPAGFGTMKLGPDNKIYCVQNPGGALSVIHQPNLAGAACQYTSLTQPLANLTYCYLGLPNVVATVIPTGDTVSETETIPVSDCFTTSYELETDTLGHSYLWDDGSNLTRRTVNASGTYWVTYFKRCVVYTDTFKVSFPNAIPLLSVYPGCKGSSNGMAVAIPMDTGYTFIWRNASQAVVSTTDSLQQAPGGQYTLEIHTSGGCDTVITVNLPEENYTASFTADSIVCQNTTLSFTNTSHSHFSSFDWTFGDGGNAASYNPSYTYLLAGQYQVRLVAEGPVCRDTAYQVITVDSLLASRFHTVPDSICMGQSIAFFPDTAATVSELRWSFGDETEMTGPAEFEVNHAYDMPGILPVHLQTRYRACPASDFTDTVYVYALPGIYLGPDTGLCLDGMPVWLQNLAPATSDISHYSWNTGDTSTSLKVVHPGEYSLTLSSGPLGCSNSETITVHKDCYVDIPNAFTPNGDGNNDYFFPRQLLSRKISRFKMLLWNRWGQVVFQTEQADGRGWDGQFNGKPQAQGVYLYRIELTIDDRREEQYTGNVTLIR